MGGLALFPILAALLVALPAGAAERAVGPGESLQSAIATAKPGDVIRVRPGTYTGTVAVTVPHLTIQGEGFPTLDAEERGPVLMVLAKGVTVRGLRLVRSGKSPYSDDAGVAVMDAPDCRILDNRIEQVFHGVLIRRSPGCLVQGNRVAGDAPSERIEGWGDGIRVWSAPRARVVDNQVSRFRDGIYLEFSRQSRIHGNRVVKNRRYGLHFMYMDDSRFHDNRFTDNQAGSVLMYSKRIQVVDNTFADNRGSVGQGLLFRDNNDSLVAGNRVLHNSVGLFLDGANRNRFRDNVIAGNGWGMLLFSSSADNYFSRNTFWGNHYEVAVDMPRSNNHLQENGIGNYWSGYRGYDLNGDGRGDVAHGPVSVFAYLAMQYPDLYAFANSPAVRALEFAQRLLPSLAPSDLLDRAPLMRPGRRDDRG